MHLVQVTTLYNWNTNIATTLSAKRFLNLIRPWRNLYFLLSMYFFTKSFCFHRTISFKVYDYLSISPFSLVMILKYCIKFAVITTISSINGISSSTINHLIKESVKPRCCKHLSLFFPLMTSLKLYTSTRTRQSSLKATFEQCARQL